MRHGKNNSRTVFNPSVKEEKTMKKFISIFLALIMILAFAGCDDTPDTGDTGTQGGNEQQGGDGETSEPVQLAEPQDLNLSGDGTISWSYVPHARSYLVTADGASVTVTETSYKLSGGLPAHDFTYSVIAKAEGYLDSPEATGSYTVPDAAVSILGAQNVASGATSQYNATVTGAVSDKTVTWSVSKGGEYASISNTGLLTAKDVTGDQVITIRATSNGNDTKYAEKTVTIRAYNELTQEMLDELAHETTVEFLSTIDIDVYTIGSRPEYIGSSQLDSKTAMDGTHWYASYQTGDGTGLSYDMYVTKANGVPNAVSVSLMNEEELVPMLDDNGNELDWEEAGMYNCFSGSLEHPRGFRVSDFEFDGETFAWTYKGNDKALMQRMISAAIPYDFTPKTISLIVEEGEVLGFTAVSENDSQVSPGNNATMTLSAIINYGENVTVPTISKFTFDEEIHTPLKTALENMHALHSYTMIYRNLEQNALTSSSIDFTGYKETVTDTVCLYEDFVWEYGTSAEDITYTYSGYKYGFQQVEDGLYNQFVLEGDHYEATRAFRGSVKDARPGLNFAAEIFTGYAKGETGGDFDMYYEVDQAMNIVATEFYRYVDVLDQLYGLYASVGYTGSGYIRPSITVKDGYITEMEFYYYMGYISGIIQVEFSDFNSASIGEEITFTKRDVPTSWDGILFNAYDDGEFEGQEFLPYAQAFLGTEEEIPFFGAALGDCFAWAIDAFYRSNDGRTHKAVELWYDVPADLDYTITSSIGTVCDWLETQDYTKTATKEGSGGMIYEYSNGKFGVAVKDSQGLLYIDVWVIASAESEPAE